MVLEHWVTDVIASYSVTRESEIWGRKLELMKVLMKIERGRGNWIMLLSVASIEKIALGC